MKLFISALLDPLGDHTYRQMSFSTPSYRHTLESKPALERKRRNDFVGAALDIFRFDNDGSRLQPIVPKQYVAITEVGFYPHSVMCWRWLTGNSAQHLIRWLDREARN